MIARSPTAASVLHVTTSLDMGGAQAMLAKLIDAEHAHSARRRHSIVSLIPPGVLSPERKGADCRTYSLGMRRATIDPRAMLRLLRIVGTVRPDIVQGWMYHGNLAASICALMRGGSAPILWNVRHSLVDVGLESRATRAILSLSARLSRNTAAIIYNAQASARQHEAIGFCAERSVHIPNGFDCTRFRPAPGARALLNQRFGISDALPVIAMIARYHPMKDHPMLVEACVRLRAAGCDAHLILAGPGIDDPSSALSQAVAAALPADRVTMLGERLDVHEWLPGVDVVALSSAWGEAFPNVLGEAMACGVPSVATDVGDSEWVIGESGIVVPPRDAVAMATGLQRLIDDGADARRRRGAAGRARVLAKFEIDDIAQQYRRLYSGILTNRFAGTRPAGEGAAPRARERAT